MRWMGIVSVVALFGCGHTQSTATASRPTGEQAHSEFATAYDEVRNGIEAKATAGKYTFVDRGEGVINVTDEDKRAAEDQRLDRVADRWIEREVSNKLESDPSIGEARLDIESSGGVVHLFGTVDDANAAERTIRTALESDGVRAVNAELQLR